jgi:hypothetical protein
MREWKYAKIDISKILDAKENANKMSDEEFDQLVDNIRVGGLSSAPALWHRREDDKYIIISGHHRIKACKKLCIPEVGCLYVEDEELTDDEKIATQLSHNSLHGQDNLGILKRMLNEIHSIDFKKFAHIDIDQIQSVPVFSSSIVPESEHYNVSFILYKKDIDTLQELMGIVKEDFTNSELVVIADQENTEDFMLNLIKEVQKKYGVKSSNIAFSKILELAKKQLESE